MILNNKIVNENYLKKERYTMYIPNLRNKKYIDNWMNRNYLTLYKKFSRNDNTITQKRIWKKRCATRINNQILYE